MGTDHERELGGLEARMTAVELTLTGMGNDLKAIRSRTDRASGFVILVILCIPAAAGAALTWFLSPP